MITDAVGHEEEWLAEWSRCYRDATGSVERQVSGGRWVLYTDRRMKNGGTAGLRIDITALKRTRAELHASEARLDRAQKIANIGSWEWDAVSGELVFSRHFYHIRGVLVGTRPTAEEASSRVDPADSQLLVK